jgi:hypothetical protein
MCRIGGSLAIDLGIDDEHRVERLIQAAAHAPAGADVVFSVRPRQFTPYWAIAYLREHGAHLGAITVHCSDPGTIKLWVTALRGQSE